MSQMMNSKFTETFICLLPSAPRDLFTSLLVIIIKFCTVGSFFHVWVSVATENDRSCVSIYLLNHFKPISGSLTSFCSTLRFKCWVYALVATLI